MLVFYVTCDQWPILLNRITFNKIGNNIFGNVLLIAMGTIVSYAAPTWLCRCTVRLLDRTSEIPTLCSVYRRSCQIAKRRFDTQSSVSTKCLNLSVNSCCWCSIILVHIHNQNLVANRFNIVIHSFIKEQSNQAQLPLNISFPINLLRRYCVVKSKLTTIVQRGRFETSFRSPSIVLFLF